MYGCNILEVQESHSCVSSEIKKSMEERKHVESKYLCCADVPPALFFLYQFCGIQEMARAAKNRRW